MKNKPKRNGIMHRKDYNNNIISTQQREINEVGINNNGYDEYLNTITSTGQKDSSNEDHFKKLSNGVRQAVLIHYRKLRIKLLTQLNEWQKKTDRAYRKLTGLRSDIKSVKTVNASLNHVRFSRGFLYASMGTLFFLGEVEFSKQTIIYALQMANIKIWWQATLVLALASTTGLCKLVYERFIEPYYDERDKNVHATDIRKFYFMGTGLVVTLFTMIAYYRAVIAKIQLLEIDNPYTILNRDHGYIMVLVYVAIALLFLLGSAILLPIGLKELSNWYKIKMNKSLIDRLLVEEKQLENAYDECSNNLNKHKHTIEFMDNKEDFNDYLENEIQFFNTQYQRGIMKGVEEIESDEELTLNNEPNNQKEEELLIHEKEYEETQPMNDFHLRVRKNLDNTALLQ